MSAEHARIRVGVNALFMIPGEVGGTETYLRRTLAAVAEHHPEVELVVFTNRENDLTIRDDLCVYEQVHFRFVAVRAANRYARIMAEQTSLPAAARRERIDVLWSLGYTAPLLSPCAQVVTIHDMQYKTHPEDLAPHYRFVTDILVRAAARRAVRIIAISEFGKSEIARYTAAPAGRIDVTHLAADASYAEPLTAEQRRAALRDLPPVGERYILCVSNTYPHKNVHALVEAYGLLAGAIPHRLVLVGKPRLGEPRLRAALAELPDDGRFVRLERTSANQLRALYQGADVFVFPSLYEGFGLPVLEAMTAGVPVVAARRAAIPEAGGDEIVYFDPGRDGDMAEKIREVLRWTPEKRAELTGRAAARARMFTWRETADRTVAILKRALETAC